MENQSSTVFHIRRRTTGTPRTVSTFCGAPVTPFDIGRLDKAAPHLERVPCAVCVQRRTDETPSNS